MPRRLVAAHHECHVRPRRRSQKSGADLVEGRTSPYRGFPQLQLRLTSTTVRFWAYAWSVLLQHICKQCSGLSMSLQVYVYRLNCLPRSQWCWRCCKCSSTAQSPTASACLGSPICRTQSKYTRIASALTPQKENIGEAEVPKCNKKQRKVKNIVSDLIWF